VTSDPEPVDRDTLARAAVAILPVQDQGQPLVATRATIGGGVYAWPPSSASSAR
jgi:hypothetical protein